jgi:hypothetical protein
MGHQEHCFMLSTFNSLKTLYLGAAILCLLITSGFSRAQAQDQQVQDPQDDPTRQIKLSTFTNKRPAGGNDSKGSKPASGDTASWNAPTYRRVKPRPRTHPRTASDTTKAVVKDTPKAVKSGPVEVKEVGVTIWRLRPATETDTGPGFSVLKDGKLVVMTPERVEGTAPVALGERVRISIESPRTGFLYVIDREQYADGTTGSPALIFPTTRVRGGDNAVVAGRLTDIPDTNDSQPFFTLTSHQKPGEPEIVGELLTVLITDQPMKGITPARGPIPLETAQVAKWEEQWSGEIVELLEMNGGAGKTWTVQEKQSGENTRSLTQEDPTPETIYRVSGKAGEPVMLTVQLLYGSAAKPQVEAAAKP